MNLIINPFDPMDQSLRQLKRRNLFLPEHLVELVDGQPMELHRPPFISIHNNLRDLEKPSLLFRSVQ